MLGSSLVGSFLCSKVWVIAVLLLYLSHFLVRAFF